MTNKFTSCHPDRGMDYHLRMLGINNREKWNLVSNDQRTYDDTTTIAKPDFVIEHQNGHQVILIEYKNRLYDGVVHDQERIQVQLSAMAVQGDYLVKQDRDVTVESYLLYGSGNRIPVTLTEDEADTLIDQVTESNAGYILYAMGRLKNSSDLLPARMLSEFLTDTVYSDHQRNAREAGTKAHKTLGAVAPRKDESIH